MQQYLHMDIPGLVKRLLHLETLKEGLKGYCIMLLILSFKSYSKSAKNGWLAVTLQRYTMNSLGTFFNLTLKFVFKKRMVE